MVPQYKFVEVSPVTSETLEDCVNEWVRTGWQLEGIRFVTTEHSKRPSMAFVAFIRETLQAVADREPPRIPRPLVAAGGALDDGPDGVPDRAPGGIDDEGPAVITALHGTDVD